MAAPGPARFRSRFPRAFRLKRQRLLRPLFDRKRSDVRAVRAGSLLVRYRIASLDEVGQQTPLQIGFAVGRTVQPKPARNRIKRLLRESFRLHRHDLAALFADRPETLTLVALYRGRAEGASPAIRRDLPEALGRIATEIRERTGAEP